MNKEKRNIQPHANKEVKHLMVLLDKSQASEFKKLLSGHERAREEAIEVTDDASILEREKTPVKLVPGTETNIKITVREDLAKSSQIAESILGQINEAISSKK